MTSLADCIFLMLDCIQFDGLMQRHQHVAREMSKFLPVIYAEGTPSRIRRILDGVPFDPTLVAYKRGLQEIGDNLSFYKSPPYMPRQAGYYRSGMISGRRVAQNLKPLLPRDKKVITWLPTPLGFGTIGLYDEALSVFDYFDAFALFPDIQKFSDQVIRATTETASSADLVIATNIELRDSMHEFNSNAHVVRNGCDPDHFATGGLAPAHGKLAVDIDSFSGPVIGYMGDIADWMDFDCITNMAIRHPEWSIVLIGTWKRTGHPPKDIPNLFIPGPVPYAELPYYARKFDIGTIPFTLTGLTRVVNPLKLYEYFAMGIPVLATPLPEVVHHEDLVYVARNPDEFVALAEVALKEPIDSPARARRVEVARANSWRARGEEIKSLLEINLSGK